VLWGGGRSNNNQTLFDLYPYQGFDKIEIHLNTKKRKTMNYRKKQGATKSYKGEMGK